MNWFDIDVVEWIELLLTWMNWMVIDEWIEWLLVASHSRSLWKLQMLEKDISCISLQNERSYPGCGIAVKASSFFTTITY